MCPGRLQLGLRQARRILILKPSSLGDIVHALPVLAALRAAYPDAHIAWLVADSFAPLLEGHPLLDEVIRFDRRRYGRMWRTPATFVAFWRFVAEMRRRRFDLIIDLQGLIRSGLLSFFSGARERIGFADARELAWLFYTRRVRIRPDVEHAVERNLHVAAALGLRVATPQFPLAVNDEERAAARNLLAEAAGGPLDEFIAVVPGARWPSKVWPPERLAALIDRLHAAGRSRCVLVGGPDDRPLADRVRAACTTGVVDLVGRTTLRQLVAVLDLAERVLCCDSGPMHIAAALGKPTLAIFGPTNPRRTGPCSPLARVVTHAVQCAPCFRRVCPLGHHACLQRLEVAAVFDGLQSLRSVAASA